MRKVSKEKSIATLYPELLTEWYYEKNQNITLPTEVSKGSHIKVWWICNKGHFYEKVVKEKVKGKGCPYCANKKANIENCLLTVYPEIAKEWDHEKNLNTPKEVLPGSSKKVWWICPKQHSYFASIAGRKRGRGCPYCANLKINEQNSFAKLYPEIASEWHYDKNNKLLPTQIPPGTSKKIWWKCANNHSYQMTVYNRVKAQGCPKCSNKIVHKDYNLNVTNPSLAKEWHPTKNNQLLPDNVSPNANKKVWWICAKKHEWEAYISNRNGKNSGCPYCKNLFASDETCLANIRPDLALDWDNEKNNGITAKDVLPFSNKRYWWICPEGHSYEKVVADRSLKGSGCPLCYKLSGSSFPEFSLYYYLKKSGLTVSHREIIRVDDVSFEADILLPSIQTIIEYDGKKWHLGKEDKDREKNLFFKKNGYSTVRVREAPLTQIDESWNYLFEPSNLESYASMIFDIFNHLKIPINFKDIFTNNDLIDIRTNFYHVKRANSIATIEPKLLQQWHSTKNTGLNPNFISTGSNVEIIWECEKGHEYSMNVKSRMRGRGCPFCTGKRVNESNSFAAIYPELVNQWDSSNIISPYEVTAGSKKVVTWRCPNGPDHIWETPVYSRKSFSCPYCQGRRVSITNNLAVTYPQLAKEWHPSKNDNLTPWDVTKGMSKKVWWQCAEGHEWEESLNQRSNKKSTCRVCNQKQ
ncbi:zinc-ribbon domain-containing protein [Solibacillus sp. FSL H8-0523]|uniref:zinc-ribbon domain-containing protein n=1 Tax=Solibacillus sp. FSL H8-0523 TaxID=2954511 RepID=UPI0031016A0A